MKQENTSVTMTVNRWEDGQLSTTTPLILLILIATVFVGSILFVLPIPFMDNGARIDPSTRLPAVNCHPLAAQARQLSTTERQSDYIICLQKATK